MIRLEPTPSPCLLEPGTVAFVDEGSFANNPGLAFLVCCGGIELRGSPDA